MHVLISGLRAGLESASPWSWCKVHLKIMSIYYFLQRFEILAHLCFSKLWVGWDFFCKRSSETVMLANSEELFCQRSALLIASPNIFPNCWNYASSISSCNNFQKEAEAHLPCLTSREGIMINMDDPDNLQAWTFKYRSHAAI